MIEQPGAPSRFIPDHLRPLRSLVLIVTDRQGKIVDANQGLYDVLPNRDQQDDPPSVEMLLIDPTLEELLARTEGQAEEALIYTGSMTLGDIDGVSETWEGRAYHRGSSLLVVCERDVQQDRRLQWELVRTNRKLAYYANEVEKLSLTDSLTGIANRRSFDQFMQHDVDLSERHGDPLTVLVIDLDRFKTINDRLGHQYGDRMLIAVANRLTEAVRAADTLARWGGEEFAVLAPRTDLENGLQFAERLRVAIEAIPSPEEDLPMTASIGLAERANGESIETFLQRADAALYRAKRDGRNRVISAEVDE